MDAGPPAVRFIGRFDQAPAAGPKVSYPGASIIARFMGTEVKAKFEDIALFSPPYGANRWEAVVDGVSTATIQLDRMQATTYTLAAGLVNGAHTVELHKLTEASVGTSQFEGFDFPGGALLPPPLPANRHLQFLGDSSANGYGVDGAAGCTFSAATENERRSFPALIAHDLLADHHNLGASGKGIFQNYARPGDTDVFAVIYQLTNVTAFHAGIAQPVWDSTKYTPDVVWITLGGNDYDPSSVAVDPAPPPASFLAKYQQLVSTIRTQHPLAYVFCAVAPSLNDTSPAGFNAYSATPPRATATSTPRSTAPWPTRRWSPSRPEPAGDEHDPTSGQFATLRRGRRGARSARGPAKFAPASPRRCPAARAASRSGRACPSRSCPRTLPSRRRGSSPPSVPA